MKVAINSLGRIGRATLRVLQSTAELELVAANDLVPIDNLEYLIRYDTVYGRNPDNVVGGTLVKVMGWYDNEWGYTNQMVRHAVARAGAMAGATS